MWRISTGWYAVAVDGSEVTAVAVLSDQELEDAIHSIERDGYAVLREIVGRDQLGQLERVLHAAFDELSASGDLFDGGGTISGHLNCYPGVESRFVYDALERGRVIDIVRALAPEQLDAMRVTMNYNLPGSHDQHYHSDGLFTDRFLVCNVAVVDTDIENGAIDMLPGTHHRFYKFWQYALGREFRRSTRVPMRQGDVLVRYSTCWHRGMRNLTSTPRPMFSATFGEASAPDGDPFEVERGQVVFLPNWYGTSRVGQLRERVFVAAPWMYSTLRFGRSLVGNKGYSSW